MMIKDAALFKKIFGVIGAVVLVLIISVFFPPEADFSPIRPGQIGFTPLAKKDKNQPTSTSSAEIQGVSDEFVVGDNLETETAEGIDDEITRNGDHDSNDREKVKTIDW